MTRSILVLVGSWRNPTSQIMTHVRHAWANFLPHRIIIVTDTPNVGDDLPFPVHWIQVATNVRTRNGHSVVSALYWEPIQRLLATANPHDMVIVMRNDMDLILNETFRMPTEGVTVLPRPWWNLDPANLSNTNLYILSVATLTALNFGRDHIESLARVCRDTEALFVLLLKPDRLIPLETIRRYQLDGVTKFVFEDDLGLSGATFPLASSFLAPLTARLVEKKLDNLGADMVDIGL